jgi:hypothetical protein
VGSCVQRYSLAENPQLPPPPHLGSLTRALLVSQDRRHLFVTPWGGAYLPSLAVPFVRLVHVQVYNDDISLTFILLLDYIFIRTADLYRKSEPDRSSILIACLWCHRCDEYMYIHVQTVRLGFPISPWAPLISTNVGEGGYTVKNC